MVASWDLIRVSVMKTTTFSIEAVISHLDLALVGDMGSRPGYELQIDPSDLVEGTRLIRGFRPFD
jgi:hypothetical protein